MSSQQIISRMLRPRFRPGKAFHQISSVSSLPANSLKMATHFKTIASRGSQRSISFSVVVVVSKFNFRTCK
ncbi:hypothetical protein TVAG_424170 [Trichomonas vaginalis G3]|uniref:Uncharacterized protein n=1 Tax=Trichomonas vaginalis (strain ATCC PRA-98 / G3) TaxID=412133 RepID=A2E1Q7_TRIV3|nr:hypothetical protein TVAGG3_0304220 [Trichomonas vaginalis G3]EAY13386.1 hypothetical protein TVAG_424170 [Trichomonas vaginalis G3]KAI5528139.1 hypothetical protein TVAGG3_0304220 [Trichomonas vaginalis G3]|eukprot:XP_001325609.1 hypothetical protein [Trichomonas vaginalis G3]